MTFDTLTIKRDEDYFSLKYSYRLQNKCSNLEEQFVITDKKFSINVNLHINGIKLHTTDYECLVEAIGHSFVECRFWKHIDMDTSLFIRDDKTSSFLLDLECKVFTPIINDLLDVKSAFPNSINLLELIDLDFDYNTFQSKLHLADIVEALNYMFGSLIINLEFKFPFVFSFYARKLFKTNYNWLVRNLDEVLSPSPPNNLSVHPDNSASFLKSMRTVHLKALSEYNTLNVMKECDTSGSRLDACKRYRSRFLDLNIPHTPNSSIKAMVFDLDLFGLSCIESHLDIESVT